MSFTVVPEDPARQLTDPGPPEACPHCGRRAFWRNGCYERHLLLLGPCRVQRWRCQRCGRTHSRPPEGVTRQQRTRSWQAILMRLYVLGVSLRATCASLEVLGCFVSPTSLWRDVQRLQAEAPWDSAAKLPGVVLLDETWLPLEGRQQPVVVVLDTDGRPRDLRRTGPDFDWTAYFRALEARGVHTLVTDDDPAFHKALKGCGLDRQLCVVHMRRTVRRRLQRMRQGQDRILPTPEDAAVLQGVVWTLQAPGAAGPWPEDAAGGTGLPALAGRQSGLKPAGPLEPCQRSRSCPPEPFSTKVKQCPHGYCGTVSISLIQVSIHYQTPNVELGVDPKRGSRAECKAIEQPHSGGSPWRAV